MTGTDSSAAGNTGHRNRNKRSGSIVIKSSVVEDKKISQEGDIESSSTIRRDTNFILQKSRLWKLKNWIRFSSYTVLALAIMFTFGLTDWFFPTDEKPACADMGSNLEFNQSICGLVESLQNGSTLLRILSAFVLGGFLASSVNYFMIRRRAYCALCGSTRNMLINVCSIVPSSHRPVFARWTILGYELSVLKARYLLDSEEGQTYLKNLGLLVGDEWLKMVEGDRHTTVWFWIQEKASRLASQDIINGFQLQQICNAVVLSRDKANDLMSPIDRDQPTPYIYICALLNKLFLFFHAAATGFKWAIWLHDSGIMTILMGPNFYVEVIVLLLSTTTYAMIFDVCAMLYNPFGPRDIDIPHYAVGSGLRKLAKSLSQGDNYPGTMEKCDTTLKDISLAMMHGQNQMLYCKI